MFHSVQPNVGTMGNVGNFGDKLDGGTRGPLNVQKLALLSHSLAESQNNSWDLDSLFIFIGTNQQQKL